MFLFVHAGAKERSDEISKFQFLIPANKGAAKFSLQKEVLMTVVSFLVYFAVLSLVFKMK